MSDFASKNDEDLSGRGTRNSTADVESNAPAKELRRAVPERRIPERRASLIVQAKLAVGPTGDRFEREADEVAARVVRKLRTGSTSTPESTTDSEGRVQRSESLAAPTPQPEPISRIQRSAFVGAAGGELDEGTDRMLKASRGGGRPLPDAARSPMESAFGADFSHIRVHSGSTSAELNDRIQAKAFTTGNDVYFRDGLPSVTSSSGQELLAHELTHTIQQGAAAHVVQEHGTNQAEPPVQRKAYKIGSTDETLEIGFFTGKSKREAMLKEAEEIILVLKTSFDLEVSSSTTVDAIQAQYTNVKDKVSKSLRTRSWKIAELRALKRALEHYAPILGGQRASSSRAGSDQEVTSVGKVKQAIDANQPSGKLDTTTLGEFFRGKKNMGLFRASEGFKADFANEGDQLTGTFIHEIAHGLLEYTLPDYIAAT
ncbi:DUF4157 domain-containing protein, partial [bacterium]|nr:DUF4157 domain-containing protein [bacterium]